MTESRDSDDAESLDLIDEVSPQLTPIPTDVRGVDRHRIDLTGTWNFCIEPEDEFFEHSPDAESRWDKIEVPGEWTMQGFSVPEADTAGYRRRIRVPADWEGMQIKLRFDAVYSAAEVWVDDERVGEHKGGFTPFECDITHCAEPGGEHSLALSVRSHTLADDVASGIRYAAHDLGGIIRPVTLFAVPSPTLSRLHVETWFDDEYHDATLRAHLSISNDGNHKCCGVNTELRLLDPNTEFVEFDPVSVEFPPAEPGVTIERTVEIPVTQPRMWDPEHPRLYTLVCDVVRGGTADETISRRVGFRDIEVRGNQVLLNGDPITLRGVCRHEAHPTRGRSLTSDLCRRDAELFRECNVNYVRTSHYPPAEPFIDACDELGILVEEEAPFCWTGREGVTDAEYATDPAYRELIVRQTAEMVERDLSHPSVIIWSIANESRWGENFEASAQYLYDADPTRLLTFNWAEYEETDADFCDIGAEHYPGLDGIAAFEDHFRPILFDEYCHLNTYNRRELFVDPGLREKWGEWLVSMWEKVYQTDGCLGGALWSGIDDLFYLTETDPSSIGYGEWGAIDGWRRRKPEFWHIKKTYSPVKLLNENLDDAGSLRLSFGNRHDFANLNEGRFEWKVGDCSGVITPDVPPRTDGSISVDPGAALGGSESLILRYVNGQGETVDEWKFEHLLSSDTSRANAPSTSTTPEIRNEDRTVDVSVGDIKWTFDRHSGQIQSGIISGTKVVTGGPWFTITPLTDVGSGTQVQDFVEGISSVPLDCPTDWHTTEMAVSRENDAAIVRAAGNTDLAMGEITIEVDETGGLHIGYVFEMTDDVNPREIGLTLEFTGDCEMFRWERCGQWSTYPDTHIGRRRGAAAHHSKREEDPSTRPSHPWACDATAAGTNDFRSTKHNVLAAELTTTDDSGIEIATDGSQHVRAATSSDTVRLLVADYSNEGSDPFFEKVTESNRCRLSEGDTVKGTISLQPLDR